MTIQDDLRRFIIDELQWSGSPDELTSDLPLIEKEVIDSLGVFELVSFVEDRYGIDVADEELVLENFGSLDAIAELVEAKRSAPA